MRIRLDDLDAKLAEALLPVYVLIGPEPLLLQEAGDAIRRAARSQGYEERERFDIDAGFDWSRLDQSSANLSLFCTRRLIEVYLDGGKPGRDGSSALIRYAQRPPADTVLIVRCGQLNKGGQASAWLRALDAIGGVVQVWRLERRRMPGWLQQRMRAVGLLPDRDAALLLTERVEGNLLAADQEIEKLRILNGPGQVDVDVVRRFVGDSARYDVFELVDAALAGDHARVIRVLVGLREEGVEPILISWALTREVRLLYRLRRALQGSRALDVAMGSAGVPKRRVDLLRRALERLPLEELAGMLAASARCDRIIKGQGMGSPWEELIHLSLSLAGFGPLSATRTDRIA